MMLLDHENTEVWGAPVEVRLEVSATENERRGQGVPPALAHEAATEIVNLRALLQQQRGSERCTGERKTGA